MLVCRPNRIYHPTEVMPAKRTILIVEGGNPPENVSDLERALRSHGFRVLRAPWYRPLDSQESDRQAIVYIADEGGGMPPFEAANRHSDRDRFENDPLDPIPKFLVGPASIDLRETRALSAEHVRVYDNDLARAGTEIALRLQRAGGLDDIAKLLAQRRPGIFAQTLTWRWALCALLFGAGAVVIGRIRSGGASYTVTTAVVIAATAFSVALLYRYLGGTQSDRAETSKFASLEAEFLSQARLRSLIRREIRTYSENELANWLSENRDRARISDEDRDAIVSALEGRIKAPLIRAAIGEDLGAISGALTILDRKLSEATTVLSEEERRGIVSQLSTSLEGVAARDVLEKHATIIARESGRRLSEGRAAELVASAEQRLVNEVAALSRRANANLAFGTITTIAGLILLAWVVLRSSPPEGSLSAQLSYHAGRYGLVVFVEVFAYFFLRLYKNGLGEIKYFQNELTSVQLRGVGLHLAIGSASQDALNSSIELMMKSERNRVLEKGQTTIDLEARRIDERLEVELLGLLGGKNRDKATTKKTKTALPSS